MCSTSLGPCRFVSLSHVPNPTHDGRFEYTIFEYMIAFAQSDGEISAVLDISFFSFFMFHATLFIFF